MNQLFFWCVLWLNDAEVSEWTNRDMPARNSLVQLLALYAHPERNNAQCHRQTPRRDSLVVSVLD